MSKTKMIRVRIEPSVKHDAEVILQDLELSVTEAITLFYRQVVMYRGLPFHVRVPNESTRNACRMCSRRERTFRMDRFGGSQSRAAVDACCSQDNAAVQEGSAQSQEPG